MLHQFNRFHHTFQESRYFDWRDSSMSRATPFGVTHFGSKSAVCFTYHLLFSITKNKYLNYSKIYTDCYRCRIEYEEQFLLFTQIQILHYLKTKIS
jgi:hypothetical protein